MRSIGFNPFDMFNFTLVIGIVIVNISYDCFDALSHLFTPLVMCLLFVVGYTVYVKSATFRTQCPTGNEPTCFRRWDQAEIASIGYAYRTCLEQCVDFRQRQKNRFTS